MFLDSFLFGTNNSLLFSRVFQILL